MPTPVAAAGGPDNLPAELLEGDESYRVHLDGDNRLPYLTGGPESGRDEIIYCEGTSRGLSATATGKPISSSGTTVGSDPKKS